MVEGKEEQVTFYMDSSRQRESLCRETPFIKPSDLMRLIHYHENNTGKTTAMIQLPPTGSLTQHVGIVELQFKMRSGWGHSQTVSHAISFDPYNTGQNPLPRFNYFPPGPSHDT